MIKSNTNTQEIINFRIFFQFGMFFVKCKGIRPKSMKKLLFFVAIVCSLNSFGQNPLAEITGSLKSGNASSTAKYFDNTVDINLPGKSNSYSKKQGELVLREFFSGNTVKDFSVIHKSESSTSQYFIGNLNTNNGVFRTTVYLKQKGDKQIIQEIRFEK